MNPDSKPFNPRYQEFGAPQKGRGGRRGGGKKKKLPAAAAAPATSAAVIDEAEKQRIRARVLERMGQKPAAKPAASAQSEELSRKLDEGSAECMICMSRVGRRSEVWSCTSCFVVLHFQCLRKWSSKSVSDAGIWRCPHCQLEFRERPRSVCFCGKQERPESDGYLLPGSCGSVCHRMREGTSCPHPCSLQCHPGPCAPCTLMGDTKSCFCGATTYQLGCSEVDPGRSCNQPCNKRLACGSHNCAQLCHSGPCRACAETELQSCHCGKHEEDRACGSGELDMMSSDMESRAFSCGDVCDRELACGNHTCKRKCHAGACGDCALANITTCPCGKMPLREERASCLAEIPTCGKVCGRIRAPCGHPCRLPCHAGDCPLCTEELLVQCRCGSTSTRLRCVEVPVSERIGHGPLRIGSVHCRQRCSELRNCGRHRCDTVCCVSFVDKEDAAGAHICRLTCQRKLKCGNHQCPETCHRGRCPPCLQASFDEWHCACGRTTVFPPIRCGQQMPPCPHVCTRQRACGHVDPSPHQCHEDDKECPPCVQLVSADCLCGKEHRDSVACYIRNAVKCAFLCGLVLSCGHHCEKGCHQHERIPVLEPGQLAETCGQTCNMPLATCEHKCKAPCHPKTNCPAVVCQQETVIKCPCGRRFRREPCGMGYGPEFAEINEDLRRRALECDPYCEKETRRRQLAEAFGKVKPKAQEAALLMCLGRAYPGFLLRVEMLLRRLLEDHHDFDFSLSNVIVPNVAFPSLSHPKVKLVLQLAQNWACKADVFGEDSVWVTLTADAVEPTVRISDMCRDGPCAILVDDLNTSVKTSDVSDRFRRFKHTVAWIDKKRCIVIFESLDVAKLALNTAIVPYTMSLFVDQPDDDELESAREREEAGESEKEEEEHVEVKPEEEVILLEGAVKEGWEEHADQ